MCVCVPKMIQMPFGEEFSTVLKMNGMCVRVRGCVCVCVGAYMCVYVRVCVRVSTQAARVHLQTCRGVFVETRKYSHTHVRNYTHIHKYAHTHIHIYIHTYTHKHTRRTHIYTHINILNLQYMRMFSAYA